MKKYDVIVIGGGSAGGSCATMVAEAGQRVALIERDALGGSCLNYGCDPTKTAVFTAKLLKQIRHSQKYGIASGQPSLNWYGLQERIAAVQNEMRGGSEADATQSMAEKGVEVIYGEASFLSPHKLHVNGETLYGKQIVLATGAEPAIPPIPGLRESGYVTNKDIFDLPQQPAQLLILGGGPIGVEFAQLFARFGSQVQLVEAGSQILPKDDFQLAQQLTTLLEAEGVTITLGAELTAVSPTADGKECRLTFQNGYEQTVTTSELLIAAGRRRATDALQLEKAGVAVREGQPIANQALQSSVPHIWVAGDVASDYQFTHVAWRQGQHVAQNILQQQTDPFPYEHIPWVTYTDPELAHIGQTEEQLQETDQPYRVVTAPFADVARAKTADQTAGSLKLLLDDQNKILGAHILAAQAGELLAPLLLAIQAGLSAKTLAHTVWPYPTMSTIFDKLTI